MSINEILVVSPNRLPLTEILTDAGLRPVVVNDYDAGKQLVQEQRQRFVALVTEYSADPDKGIGVAKALREQERVVKQTPSALFREIPVFLIVSVPTVNATEDDRLRDVQKAVRASVLRAPLRPEKVLAALAGAGVAAKIA